MQIPKHFPTLHPYHILEMQEGQEQSPAKKKAFPKIPMRRGTGLHSKVQHILISTPHTTEPGTWVLCHARPVFLT